MFHFESFCVQEDKFRDTDTATKIGKHIPISGSILSYLIEQPIFLCTFVLEALVESFVDALGWFATQSNAQMKLKFLEVETIVKCKLNQSFCSFKQRHCHKEPVLEFDGECI